MHAGMAWEESVEVCHASWDITAFRMLAWMFEVRVRKTQTFSDSGRSQFNQILSLLIQLRIT